MIIPKRRHIFEVLQVLSHSLLIAIAHLTTSRLFPAKTYVKSSGSQPGCPEMTPGMPPMFWT